MIIGVPKELKDGEKRVAIAPSGVASLVQAGHSVFVQSGAGDEGAGFSDAVWEACGAHILDSGAEVWARAEMVLKVKEPAPEEYGYLRPGLILFTYLHLAAKPELTQILRETGVTAIAYETVQMADGSLPLLMPMSEVAGRMAVQVGSQFLETVHGGRGVLLGGVPGVLPARVAILGSGIVGTNAARIAVGLGAEVSLLDVNVMRLRQIDSLYHGRLHTLMSNTYNITEALRGADLVISAVLVPGYKAPHLVTEAMVKQMMPGSVIVDVAIDQGGSVETVDRVTTHSDPVYKRHGVIHYAVANIPGCVPRTATLALTHVTIPYALEIANLGLAMAVYRDAPLARGVNVYQGHITCAPVAESMNLPYHALADLL